VDKLLKHWGRRTRRTTARVGRKTLGVRVCSRWRHALMDRMPTTPEAGQAKSEVAPLETGFGILGTCKTQTGISWQPCVRAHSPKRPEKATSSRKEGPMCPGQRAGRLQPRQENAPCRRASAENAMKTRSRGRGNIRGVV
jgi:hypothetical protein